ncbi:MAG: PD-(D/E)XK nuclease family protein [Bacilli bacterium]|nr:PD-(D/E)XK nuclease family protein [Bacilli bacterium]
MEKIMICSSDIKKSLLLDNNTLNNIKYYSKSDFFKSYFFSYDYKAIYYLMKKYNYPYSIAKEYLDNLYFIEDKEYKSKKLLFLRDLKRELKENKLINYSYLFRDYINNKEIVNNYYDLDLYQENVVGKIDIPEVELNVPVHEFQTMEDEVHFICVEIRKLIDKGISLNDIYLCNVSDDYYFIIDKLFSYYGIPIEIPFRNSIYSTVTLQNYLKTGELDLNSDDPVTNKIINTLGELVELEDDSIKKDIFIEICKNTYLPNSKLNNAVQIKDIKNTPFQESSHVFVLGFNQDALPSICKDIEFVSDKEKCEVDLYTTKYLNKREKKIIAYILSTIPNLTITYKLSSPFQKYYPSSLISDYNLEIIRDEVNDTEYSDLYNKIRLGELLDNYYNYGEKNDLLDKLNGYYDLPYLSYDHKFTGINRDTFLNNLSYPLRVSYTSLNSYNECKFKYFVNYVLKLGDYEETFATIVGSLYHEVLELYKRDDFDLDKEWNSYLEKKDLSLKDTVLLVRIRKDLEELIKVLKDQQQYTKFDTEYYEKELKVNVRDDIAVEFVGFVDKIMTYQKISDTYFTIVDYKTGTIDTHIEPMKYGLHMQLPIYLYLIHNSKVFDSPIFTGIYYQNILFSYPTWSKTIDKEKKDNYKLKGYSTDNIDNLSLFDSTFRESELIKSMKYDEKFDRFSKVLSDEDVYNITKYTEKVIKDTTDNILKADFSINPKVYNKENISCKYCKYHDLCYTRESDVTYLEKVDDFSFLETTN